VLDDSILETWDQWDWKEENVEVAGEVEFYFKSIRGFL